MVAKRLKSLVKLLLKYLYFMLLDTGLYRLSPAVNKIGLRGIDLLVNFPMTNILKEYTSREAGEFLQMT